MKVTLDIKEANLLRRRIRKLLDLRAAFLRGENGEVIHDFRVASRRLRETLDYLQISLPDAWYSVLKKRTRAITRRLGEAREAEVNLAILQKCTEDRLADPVALETLVYFQKDRWRKQRARAFKEVSRKRMDTYQEFLMELKGSRKAARTYPGLLEKRKLEFLDFGWSSQIDDDRLHDLRIRTKKFRYAIEVYNSLTKAGLGRYLTHVKRLQEVLGTVNDLSVLAQCIVQTKSSWEGLELPLLPAALNEVLQAVNERKIGLYPKVYPLYATVISRAPAQLPLIEVAFETPALTAP